MEDIISTHILVKFGREIATYVRSKIASTYKKIYKSNSVTCVFVCVLLSVCHNLYVGTRERKKQKIQIKKSLHTNIMYVRTSRLRKW